ncbi:MAG: sugar ABC transporter substrate-binding protein [Treponema sp.]|jgi:ABC-type glycerol-3-phosphate transport system substrate-binding protein|nr:sugar ABC transporter substrate-binding protein [Treponema sp.]
MKKLFMGVILFVAASMIVFGSANRQAAPSSSGELVINFYEHSDNDAIVNKLVEAYNASHPGIRVVYHSIPNDDYDDKIKVLAAGGSDMDIFWIRTPAQTQQFITNNALLDLSSYIQASGLDLAPIRSTSLPGAMRSGKIYGLPTTGSAWMLFYNKDLFDAKGLPYPINFTWSQYLELAKQLTYTEGGKKYWGGLCPPWTMNLGASSAGEYLTADPMPYTRRYAEVLYQMYVGDKSHPSIEDMSVGTFDVGAFFDAGNVYMMIMGDWQYNLFKGNFNVATAPMPIFDGIAQGSTVGQASYFVVSAGSKHPKEAYDFIEWALTSAQGTTIYASSKNVPSYSTPEALAEYQRLVTVPGVEYRFSAKVGAEQGTETYYGEINDAFSQEIQLYLIGEQTLDQTFTNFYKLRSEVLANNQ